MLPTFRSLRRHPERAVPEEAQQILAAGFVAHVGHVSAGSATIIPFAYLYDAAEPDRVYLHGADASRTLREIGAGLEVCVAVSLLDGLVYSKDAKAHSMNYRSVVCFGIAHTISDVQTKDQLLTRLIARYFPGRRAGEHYAAATPAHVLGTGIVEVRVTSWSAKARTGGPSGPRDGDPATPGTAGVIETAVTASPH